MRWWKWVKEALFPARCLLCKQEGDWLCGTHKTFFPAPKNEAVFHALDEILAATAYYHKTSKRIVEQFKFRGGKDVAEIMGEQLMPLIQKAKFQNYTIIPIPLHWTRKMWRGFNQAEVLARELQKKMPERNIETGLVRRKRTSQQARLGKKERQKMLIRPFPGEVKHHPRKTYFYSTTSLQVGVRLMRQHGF